MKDYEQLELDEEEEEEMVAGYQFTPYEVDFALDVLRRLPTDKNIIFSPMSIRLGLALVYAGSSGETRAELAKILSGTEADDATVRKQVALYHNAVKNYEKRWGRPRPDNIKSVNRVFIRDSFSTLPSYSQDIDSWLQAGIESISMEDKDLAVKKINDFVKGATSDKIKSIVEEDTFKESFRALLVNALYFEEKWRYPFPLGSTKPGEFHAAEGNTITIDFMTNEARWKYFETEEMQMVLLDYVSSEYSMALLLPTKKFGLDSLLNGLRGETLLMWLNSTQGYRVTVSMPKLKIETEIKNLKEILQEMGVTSMFGDSADFSKLTDGQLWISRVLHKGYIEADERGTKAAAITGTEGEGCSMIQPEKRTLTADHPFAFILIHNQGVIYMGTKRE